MIHLAHKEECCGCTACVAVCPKQCIQMTMDEEGFLYPQIDNSNCIDCGLCEKVCPMLHSSQPKEPIVCYASVHKKEEIRLNSSSGGFFTALAEETLRNGGVVFGARFDSNFKVIHDYTENIEGLSAFRGSKYVQSDMRHCYQQAEMFLKAGREVLFSGVACQIAGLKAFLHKEYEHLLTLDVLCHGVASPAVWNCFLQPYITAQKPEKLEHILFRDKRNGWQHYDFTLRYTHQEICFDRETNPYMVGYFANLYLRPACHNCPRRGCSAGSDFTIGDCWGIEKQSALPYCTDDKGVSMVMIHTPKGIQRMQQIQPTLQSVVIDYHTLEPNNPAILHRPPMSPKREEFFQKWRQQEAFGPTIARLTRPTLYKRIEKLCTPLLNTLGIKGFTKRLRK